MGTELVTFPTTNSVNLLTRRLQRLNPSHIFKCGASTSTTYLKSSQGQEDGIFLAYEQIRRNAGRGALPTLCRCCPSALQRKEV